MDEDAAPFAATLIGFGGELRLAGMAVGSGDLVDYYSAMASLDPGDLLDLYWAGRTTLVSDRHHLPIYDRVFNSFFLGQLADVPEPIRQVLRSSFEKGSVIEVPATEPADLGGDDEEANLGLIASDIEIWRNKTFTDCTEEELASLRRIMGRIRLVPPRRRTRRSQSSPTGPRPDLRRTVRNTMRTHGEPSEIFWRRRRLKMRPLVLILDVSGSMADYSRHLLQFAYSVKRASGKVEVFCFGTRLTRITRALERRRPDDAIDQAAGQVFDWEGGTRIGYALDTFVRQWARRRMSRSSIVVICSDGLDRGDPQVLATAMERLSRLCHKLVWMNPHKGDQSDFSPTTLGMKVAAPHIDLLGSGHSLASLEDLAERLPELR